MFCIINSSISASFIPTQTVILFTKKCIFKICKKYLNHVNTGCLSEEYYCCDIMKHNAKNKVSGGKDLFDLQFHITVHQEKKSEQEVKQEINLEAISDPETMEPCCLLAC